jgi:hypothetical protein
VVNTLRMNDSPESPEADWLDQCTKLSWDIENMGLE